MKNPVNKLNYLLCIVKDINQSIDELSSLREKSSIAKEIVVLNRAIDLLVCSRSTHIEKAEKIFNTIRNNPEAIL